MARSRGGRSSAPRMQTRSSSTMAAPTQHAPAPHAPAPTQQRSPGLFSQMASTAAGVAVGSAAGHTIANGVSSLFGGGSSNQVDSYQQQPMQTSQYAQQETAESRCDADAKQFAQCMDQNNGDMRICQWYMDQFKACVGAHQ